MELQHVQPRTTDVCPTLHLACIGTRATYATYSCVRCGFTVEVWADGQPRNKGQK